MRLASLPPTHNEGPHPTDEATQLHKHSQKKKQLHKHDNLTQLSSKQEITRQEPSEFCIHIARKKPRVPKISTSSHIWRMDACINRTRTRSTYLHTRSRISISSSCHQHSLCNITMSSPSLSSVRNRTKPATATVLVVSAWAKKKGGWGCRAAVTGRSCSA
jgi:hypothetical protein